MDERLLHALGHETLRQDRKRRRDATSAATRGAASALVAVAVNTETASSAAGSSTDDVAALVHPEAFPQVLRSSGAQDRIFAAILRLVDGHRDRATRTGRVFVARTAYAMFMVVQATAVIPYGPQWGALLYVCLQMVLESFSDSCDEHKFQISGLRRAIQALGMAPHTGSAHDEQLMKAARTWDREDDVKLQDAMSRVCKTVKEDPVVSVSARAVRWPCQRAHLLFGRC